MQKFWLPLLALPLACAFCAQAAPMTFFGEDANGNPLARVAFPNSTAARNSFLSQLPGSSTDTLEEFTPGTLAPFTLTFTGNSALFTDNNAAIRSQVGTNTDGNGEFPTSGNNYIATDSSAIVNIAFTSAVTSFGFYATDVGDFATGKLQIKFTGTGAADTETANNSFGGNRNSPSDGSVLFFGYINSATPFTNVMITSPGTDSFGLDDLVIGTAALTKTPEPGSALLMAAGIAYILYCKSFRKNDRKTFRKI